MSFHESLVMGQAGESAIAGWLKRKGFAVMPVYEKELETGKGPQLFMANGELIAPDLFVFHPDNKKVLWIEAKHKSAFTWHKITGRWTTGIDLRHYQDYCRVADISPWPVWLLFLQRGGQAKDSPPDSPAGLFGNTLAYLRKHENHRHANWGPSGMVYWAKESLRELASLEDVMQLAAVRR
jgi:hypothetical protein